MKGGGAGGRTGGMRSGVEIVRAGNGVLERMDEGVHGRGEERLGEKEA
jgi:hypothetical protein